MEKRSRYILLIVIYVLGLLYFEIFRGIFIPFSWFAILMGIGLLIIFAYGYLKSAINAKQSQAQSQGAEITVDLINALKNKGEKIQLDFDHCSFKGTDYEEEIQDENRSRSYDTLFNQDTPVTTFEIEQSALIYTNINSDKVERFESPVFPFSEISLKARVLQGELVLYVDRFDRTKYYFDLK